MLYLIASLISVIIVPQSLSCLLLHLIFSTKDRFPLLRDDDLLSRTHAYLGGFGARSLEGSLPRLKSYQRFAPTIQTPIVSFARLRLNRVLFGLVTLGHRAEAST